MALFALVGNVRGGVEPIIVGGKNFTESYLLSEIMAQTLESAGFAVERRFGLSGTKICYAALRAGEIHVYPEYTGTLQRVVLQNDGYMSEAEISTALAAQDLGLLKPLGFNNSYALAIDAQRATTLNINTISDLENHDELRAGFSHEFLNRPDGWPGLVATYGLDFSVTGIEHGLAYQAIDGGEIDLTDAYSTDGELTKYDLRILVDDRDFFPKYLAVPFVSNRLDPKAAHVLDQLAGTLTDDTMRELNARVVVKKLPIPVVASEFLASLDMIAEASITSPATTAKLLRNTRRHLQLTFSALGLACLAGIGLAILVYRSAFWSRLVIYVAGLFQTVPSIALLALMIPLLGVGIVPAITALFLYSLLPILRNTVTALTTVDPVYREVAKAMGLTKRQQLRYVLIPLSAPYILAGIRTAAVISIGTATLAAFIGAGGLGEPIVTGLALNNTRLILQGAIPAAVLAIVTELGFSALERLVIPSHLRAP
jgi:osmoprotectant transport system permease protein